MGYVSHECQMSTNFVITPSGIHSPEKMPKMGLGEFCIFCVATRDKLGHKSLWPCAVERRFPVAGANPAQHLSLRLVAALAYYGGNEMI